MAALLDLDSPYRQRKGGASTLRSTISHWESGRRLPPRDILPLYAKQSTTITLPQLQALHDAATVTKKGAPNPPPSGETPDATPQGPRASARRRQVAALGLLAAAGIGAILVLKTDRDLPLTTYTETTGTPARTWSDYMIAGGEAGPPLGPRQSIQVSCRVRGYIVPDGDPWWYRIESPPWNGDFYATSDAFYNNGQTSGPVDNGVIVDEQVPECTTK